MKKLNVLMGVALTALCGATGSVAAAPAVPPHMDGSALVHQAGHRCYWRHGHRVCRQVYSYRSYDYGYRPGIFLGFGFGHGHRHHHHHGH